ncbi:hypothetical protein D3C79_799350 [compost metagenome]
MGIKSFAACVIGGLGLVAQVHAVSAVSSGVLQFTGSVVEPSCWGIVEDRGVRVEQCPSSSRGSLIDVQRAENQGGVPVQIVSDGARGGTYQSYRLLDLNGKPLSRGNYVVVLTSP